MVSVHSEVKMKYPALYYGQVVMNNINVQESNEHINKERQQLLKEWEGKSEDHLNESHAVQAYRRFYLSMGFNPKKKPPAIESLIVRCVLRGFIPRINNIVDACNIAAVKYTLCMAAFDPDKFIGQPILRFSKDGEYIQPIGREKPDLIQKKSVVLADEEHVVSIFSYKDSELYKIQPETKNVLLIACHIAGIEDQQINDALYYWKQLLGPMLL